MTALENTRAALAKLDARLATPRLGKPMYREMDYDIIAMRDADTALRALADEHERLATERDAWEHRTAETELAHGEDIARWARLTAPPTDDEREALADLIASLRLQGTRHDNGSKGHPTVPDRPGTWNVTQETADEWADAVLAAGFRRQGPITEAQVERAAKALWVAGQEDHAWAVAVVDDVFSPADDWPEEAIDMANLARAALEAAQIAPQGPITDEWEYGVEVTGSTGKPVVPGMTWTAPVASAETFFPSFIRHVRRRKAGPWEPVEAARDATPNHANGSGA